VSGTPVPVYRGEARCKSWSDSPRGLTVHFDLHRDDAGETNPFKGLEGRRFALVAVPIADDERPAQGSAVQPDGPVPPPAERPRRHLSDLSPSQQAAMRLRDDRFVRWIWRMPEGAEVTDEHRVWANDRLKAHLFIDSKRDLDTDHQGAASRWRQLETQYLAETGQLAEARR
jgi:hypothetical protein